MALRRPVPVAADGPAVLCYGRPENPSTRYWCYPTTAVVVSRYQVRQCSCPSAHSPLRSPSATTSDGDGSDATFTSIGILCPFHVCVTSSTPCQTAAKVWPVSRGCFVTSKPFDFATQNGGSPLRPTDWYTDFTSA